MKKNIFWIIYACLIVVLITSGAIALGYVKGVLREYEAAQPERVVEQQLEAIRAAAQSDTLEEVMTFQTIKQAEYDIDISEFRDYKNTLKNAKELTYKIKNGYSETEQQFNILADGEKVAVLTLESMSEEVKLAILTVNEWQVKSVTPIITLANYDYTVDVPRGFRVTINGTELVNPVEAATADWESYKVETLYSEPEIKIFDAYGTEAEYDIVNNQVTPIVHTYSLRLPEGFTVSDNGRVQDGSMDSEEQVYSITTLSDKLLLTDAHGNSVEYKGGDNIYTYDYTVRIPDNFQLSVNDKKGEDYLVATEKNRKYQYVEEYAPMPEIAVYEIKSALCEPAIVIYDNLGQQVACEFNNYTFEQTNQAGLAAVPEEVAAKVDALEIAKIWSDFNTSDLKGSQNGFGTVKQYFIKDSYFYNVAYAYANGIDITFMFSHSFDNPPYTEEQVSNYVSYGDNLFSCDVHFVKHMKDSKDRSGDEKITDIMNSTFYFMNYDETDDGKDNPRWVILDIQEILSE